MRLSLILIVVVGSFLPLTPAQAQQLASPPLVLPPPAPIGTGPALNRAPPPASVRGHPQERQAVPGRVPASGPAGAVTIKPAVPRVAPLEPQTRGRVLDANGRPLLGTVPAAPDRVLDPATGRYHRITPPPPPPAPLP